MSDNSILSSWAKEVKEELKERRDRQDDLRIALAEFKSQVDTRNKIFWAMTGIFGGGMVALLLKLIQLLIEVNHLVEKMQLVL